MIKTSVARLVNGRVWHKGPPPFAGWWNASHSCRIASWRWWNGFWWSDSAAADLPISIVAKRARKRYYEFDNPIEWTTYWPEGARVPRIDPRQAPVVAPPSVDRKHNALVNSAYHLVESARNTGFVLTISQRPLKPLAMGHYESVIEVRPVLERP